MQTSSDSIVEAGSSETASDVAKDASSVPSDKQPYLSEDWTVVFVGFFIIAVTLYLFLLPVPSFGWKSAQELSSIVLTGSNLGRIALQFLFVFLFGLVGSLLLRKPFKSFSVMFPVVYIVTIAALIIAGNSQVKSFNLEAVIFSLLIGLLIGNSVTLPEWFRRALSTEFFVKIGLILLGTGVLFTDILKAGSLGLIQALVVVLSVWYFAFWICKRLKVDEETRLMISSAVSICGVSAAIATAGAIKGDPKKLSYVVSMVLITAIPMMLFMPYIAHYFHFSQAVTGAWLGGSIDTTGAVVASGSLVGEEALKISTIVKFSQNVLLGLAAFAISIYWAYAKKGNNPNETARPTLAVIWDRFPKFVLGFFAASLLFSFFISPGSQAVVKESLKNLQGLWFALAFTSIGLETRFADLFHHNSRRPLYAFLTAQLFNIFITLIIAYYLFGS